MPRISTATLDETGLRKALSQFRGDLKLIYLESETRVVLAPLEDYLGPRITLPPVRWLIGRAFGPELEIRWHLENDLYESSTLTENNKGPADWQPGKWTLDPTTRSRDVLLRGVNITTLSPDHFLYNAQPQGGTWIDIRIPRPLPYPAPDPKAERVVLQCVDYLSRELVVITRMCGLATYQR